MTGSGSSLFVCAQNTLLLPRLYVQSMRFLAPDRRRRGPVLGLGLSTAATGEETGNATGPASSSAICHLRSEQKWETLSTARHRKAKVKGRLPKDSVSEVNSREQSERRSQHHKTNRPNNAAALDSASSAHPSRCLVLLQTWTNWFKTTRASSSACLIPLRSVAPVEN